MRIKSHFEENQTTTRPNRWLYDLFFQKRQEYKKAYTQNTEKGIIYFLHEEGYDTQTFMFTEKKEFHKQMKKLIEKEFPRSHKLYVNQQF